MYKHSQCLHPNPSFQVPADISTSTATTPESTVWSLPELKTSIFSYLDLQTILTLIKVKKLKLRLSKRFKKKQINQLISKCGRKYERKRKLYKKCHETDIILKLIFSYFVICWFNLFCNTFARVFIDFIPSSRTTIITKPTSTTLEI